MKTFWYQWTPEPGLVPYDPTQHLKQVSNFLFWLGQDGQEDLLIVGSGDYKVPEEGGSHKALKLRCSEHMMLPDRRPDGAGNRMADKLSWQSSGFGVNTPLELRPRISAALLGTPLTN